MSAMTSTPTWTSASFRHEAYLYAGEDEFLDGAKWFVEDAVAADETMLVAVDEKKIDMLRSTLGPIPSVRYADMAEIGLNPARIMSVWREFLAVETARGRKVRGIGEPIWSGRAADELRECQRHEQLVNLAFGALPPWWLLCPYDTDALEPAVVEESRRSHPFLLQHGHSTPSAIYRGDTLGPDLDSALPEPTALFEEFLFDLDTLNVVRDATERHAQRVGLDPTRQAELVFAVNEVASNSVRYAGGGGL